PGSVVTLRTTPQVPVVVLGVPTPIVRLRSGSTLVSVTFRPPTTLTTNGWELTASGVSDPVNVSLIVGAIGVGAAGGAGSLHAAARSAAPSAAARILFIASDVNCSRIRMPSCGRWR